jgi:autotransporter-associated beta strand protein
VPVPTAGGTGTEIADAVGATALTGDINVAALRANNNISGAFTLNLATGGLLVRGATAGPNISANVNFGAAEGVVGLAQVNQVTTISGKVSGTNGLTKFGQATLILSNATNDFTGGVTVNEANLRAGVASTATASPFGFSGGAFNVVTINPAGTLDINNLATRIGGLQGSGIATNLGGTANTVLTVDVAPANTLTFNGALTDGGSAVAFTKAGSGSQILAGTVAHSGATTVSGGTLRVDGFSTRASAYAVNTGATLAGRGIITGAVTVNSGGNLAPGASPGTLRTGNLTLAGGSNFQVELNGAAAGTGYDQVDVIGTVNVTDANLVATLNYAPSAGDLLYVINNDQLDFVTGTFASLPQGATLNLVSTADNQTYPFTISYTGEFLTGQYENIGNDVVLRSVVPEPASAGLLALGAVGLLARRRRHRVA